MKQTIPKFPLRGLQRAGLLAAATSIGVIALLIFIVSGSLNDRIDEQASSNTDTTQWSLAQTEVEMRRLQVAVLTAMNGTGTLGVVRQHYDILFSRINVTSQGQQFSVVRGDPEARSALAAIASFLTSYEPVIDADDATLLAALPLMADDLRVVAPEARRFALAGVRIFAERADLSRVSVGALLSRIAILTLVLVSIFFLVIFFLLKLVQRSTVAEMQAAEARNRLQEVISTSIDGVLTIGRDGRIIDYNGAAEGIFGYTRKEAIGAMMSDLIIPEHLRDAHESGMARYRDTGEYRVVGKGLLRLEATRKDGLVFPVELSISKARADGREIFVSYIRDISSRVTVEQELIETRDKAVAGEKAKADLIAVMSHEMRTPLNGLLGTMELLQGTEIDARQGKYLSAMETSARLLLHHVNGVLSISKADAGHLELSNDVLEPGAFLEELVESQRPAFEANGNRITFDAKYAPEHIWVDKVKLLQVVLNLVANANKFTRDGDITVECDQLSDGRTVEFRISDTGIGIAEEDHDAVFEDFRTLDTSYGRKAEGSGLGLGISRRLVDAMGGDIDLESELGVGSIFTLRLPIGTLDDAHPKPVNAHVEPDRMEPEHPLRVLLVEDNEINRLVATDMLTTGGHHVSVAVDGAQGVSMAAEDSFDLILMDISMPELDGVEATRLIRNGSGPNHDVPIIALTAHALRADQERFEDAGISETVVKPLGIAALNTAMAKCHLGVQGEASTQQSGLEAVIGALSQQIGERATQKLVAQFVDEVDQMLFTLKNDRASVSADVAHSLAGSASVLGRRKLHPLLQILEDQVRSSGRIGDEFVTEFAYAWDEEREALSGAVGA